MREVIEVALERFADSQLNIASKTAREAVTDEIMDTLQIYLYSPSDGVRDGKPGLDCNLVLIDKDELDYLIQVKQLAAS